MTASDSSSLTLSQDQHVLDAVNDIATNDSQERVKVNCVGHLRFQTIWLRGNDQGEKTSTPHVPEDDALSQSWTSILPSRAETEGRTHTLEFRMVGAVIADEPLKYSTHRTGPKDMRKTIAREARGVLDRPAKVLRPLV